MMTDVTVIYTIIKTTTSVGEARLSVVTRVAGWPVTVGVVEVGVVDTRYGSDIQEQTLSGRGARVYTAHRGWLGVVTGISAASTGGVLIQSETRCT